MNGIELDLNEYDTIELGDLITDYMAFEHPDLLEEFVMCLTYAYLNGVPTKQALINTLFLKDDLLSIIKKMEESYDNYKHIN